MNAVAQRQADKRSLGFQFKQQLMELVKLIESGKAHYVRSASAPRGARWWGGVSVTAGAVAQRPRPIDGLWVDPFECRGGCVGDGCLLCVSIPPPGSVRRSVSAAAPWSGAPCLTCRGRGLGGARRCVKPNNVRKAHNFDASNVVRQLRCSGVTETVRARRAGWPVNYSFSEFVQRFEPARGLRKGRMLGGRGGGGGGKGVRGKHRIARAPLHGAENDESLLAGACGPLATSAIVGFTDAA